MACVMTWSDSVVSLLLPLFSEALFAILCLCRFINCMRFATSGEKTSAESRAKELEEALVTQRAESKKELDAATNSATARERGYAEQLAEFAQVMGGE